MPFTVSHVAAVLPFRRYCSTDEFAALAIGSMMPDMHYFLPVLRDHWPLPSHHLISLPLFCLPAGWLLWGLWRPLWTSADMVGGPPPALWRVLVALGIGALTHLAWDACTHANYGLGLCLPMLGQPLFRIGNAAISSANLLQYGSSVAGLLMLAAVAWPARQRFVRGMHAGVPMSWFLASLFAAAMLTAALTFAFTWSAGDGTNQLRHAMRLTAWNGLSSPLLMIMSYRLIWRWRQRKSMRLRPAAQSEL